MPTYLCLQRSRSAGTPPGPSAPPSPAQMDAMYAAFAAWQDTYSDQLVDVGGRLGAGVLVADESEINGAFVEVNELVGGYMIVEADTLDGAVEVARACPGLVRPGSGVEVVEIQKG